MSWKAFPRLFLPCRVLKMFSHTKCGILCWSCFFHEQVSCVSNPLLMKFTWPRLHFLVILLLIYSATKKEHMILHEAPLGTIVHGVYLLWCGTIAALVTSVNMHTRSPFVSMDFLQVGSRVETRTLSVKPEAFTEYPSARRSHRLG